MDLIIHTPILTHADAGQYTTMHTRDLNIYAIFTNQFTAASLSSP